MSDAFRTRVIRTLIEEIALLTGGRFEKFGYAMMRVIHPAQWVERGTTVEGAPRGYTVDSSAVGATLVAEMSSESDYFHGELSKPKRDLAHAIKIHPDVTSIWLLAAREAEAGETTKCANLATEFTKTHLSVKQADILDARRIADQIFDNLESERFVDALASFLPSVGRLADEHAFSHRIPSYPRYLPRPSAEDAVIQRLKDASYCVVKGISGIGKSALAAKVAQTLRPNLDLVIWYDARELNDVAQLSDVDVRRVGSHHNVTSLLRRYECLLILDDAVIPADQIAGMDVGRSKVLLTCQSSADPRAVTVSDLDAPSARRLLEEGGPGPCPDAVFSRVVASVGGYPLLLLALNVLAQDEGWAAVNACCEDAVSSIEDERHTKVCTRILLRHRESLAPELEFVKWVGAPRFVAELASSCVSHFAVRNLQKRAFLAATASGYARVHDVVYSAIRAVVEVSAERDSTFRDGLDQFIRTEWEQDRIILRRVAQFHTQLLQRLLGSDRRPSFVYAVALARSNDTPVDLIGDPVVSATTLSASDQWAGREIEIRAVIEAVEASYSLTSASRGQGEARLSLQRNITALELLRDSRAATGVMLRDLTHHHAKMLERLGKLPEAEAEFRAVLAKYPTFAAGRLQLARILEKVKRKPEALDECRAILTQYLAAEPSVSVLVLLETLRLLATVGSPEDVRSYESVIMSTLARARELDRSLAFDLIASVAQKTWFSVPELVLRMFDSIEWRDSVPASDPERFSWAQAHKAAAKATSFDDPRRLDFLIAAEEVYEALKAPNDYQRVHHAEALILLERFKEANARLDQVGDGNRECFWWQRKAQALLGMKQAEPALDAINKALSTLKDQKFVAAFRHDRFRIRTCLSDATAREDLLAAIEALPPGDKYRTQLEKELAKLAN